MRLLAAIFAAFLLASAPRLAAQQPDTPRVGAGDTVRQSGPVPVPRPPAQAVRFQNSGVVLWVIDTLVALAIPALILLTGASARLRDTTRRWGKRWYPALVLYLLAFGLLSFLLELPLGFYEGFVRLHAYGLSNQSLGRWAWHTLLGLGVAGVAGAVTIWAPYLLIRKTPRWWWAWLALLTIPYTAFVLIISPLWIEPLFNHFAPLQNRELAARIHTLARQAGIGDAPIYQVDMSRDTRSLNAYVTGIGGTERVVLWDTLIKTLPEREVLFATAHEMGHYVLHHTAMMIVVSGVLALIAGWVVDRTARWALRRWGERWRVHDLADPAALPLLLIWLQLVLLVVSPALLAFSRYEESAADRFALELTHDPYAGAKTFVDLGRENLSVPWPPKLLVWFAYTHPPLGERIETANAWGRAHLPPRIDRGKWRDLTQRR